MQAKMDSSKVDPQEKSNNKEKTNHDNQKKVIKIGLIKISCNSNLNGIAIN